MKIEKKLLATLFLVLTGSVSLPVHAMHYGFSGAVFTANNSANGNKILMLGRDMFGRLRPVGWFSTGGLGTGSDLGNQGAIALSYDRQWLFSVNAGSNDISVFKILFNGLKLVDVEPSHGDRPVSLAVDGELVYVLNAGSDSISGFKMDESGALTPLTNSTRSLSGTGTEPAQISFTPQGNTLVVTEKATNTITTFPLDGDGVPGEAVLNTSAGTTPFGFSFDRRGYLLVSEAASDAEDASSVSSYQVNSDSHLNVISEAIPTTETAACWLLVSKRGGVAFTSNTLSSTLSAFSINRTGGISLIQEDGVAGNTVPGSRPLDLAQSDDGRFVYALSAIGGSISAFYVDLNGNLQAISSISGLIESVNGLVAY